MKDQTTAQTKNLTPKYAHLDYQVLHDLDISITEYFLLDMIYRLSGNGTRFCQKKLDNIAYDMNMSRRAVIDNRDRLIGRGLLIKGSGNKLRTSEKVQKVYFSETPSIKKVQKVHRGMQNLHSKSADNVSKTSVENNSRITLDNRNVKNRGKGYKSAREILEQIKQKSVVS